jgi:hypothetical protein
MSETSFVNITELQHISSLRNPTGFFVGRAGAVYIDCAHLNDAFEKK